MAPNTIMGQLYPQQTLCSPTAGNAASIKLIIRDEVLDFIKNIMYWKYEIVNGGRLSNKAAHSIAAKADAWY